MEHFFKKRPDCSQNTEHEESYDAADTRICADCGLQTTYKLADN
ncbi:hypothetical protein [Vibrio sp. R78045]